MNIHPFRVCLVPRLCCEIASNTFTNQDGNGRVTRTLVSAILLRFGLLPFLVTDEDKDVYVHALMAVSYLSQCITMTTLTGSF